MAREVYTFKATKEEIAIIQANADKCKMSRSGYVLKSAMNNQIADETVKKEFVKGISFLSTEINKTGFENPTIDLGGIRKGVNELWRILV